jgi:uncharacterized membrane protein
MRFEYCLFARQCNYQRASVWSACFYRKETGGIMGEWLVWMILGALILLVFCIYSLSAQLERCVHLAVEIITGNQRKIMAQLDALAVSQAQPTLPQNVIPFERRFQLRRAPIESETLDERRLF